MPCAACAKRGGIPEDGNIYVTPQGSYNSINQAIDFAIYYIAPTGRVKR